MITLCWLVAILVCAALQRTNALLAIVAILLVEIGLTAGQIRQGVTDLCRMLKDDDDTVEDLRADVSHALAEVRRAQPTHVHHEGPKVAATIIAAPQDWLTRTKES